VSRGPRWKRRLELGNDGKPLTVWHRDGLQIAQDAVSLKPEAKGTDLVFHVYEDNHGNQGAQLGESKTLNGAKEVAKGVRDVG